MLVDQKSTLSDNHMKVDMSSNSILFVLLSLILYFHTSHAFKFPCILCAL